MTQEHRARKCLHSPDITCKNVTTLFVGIFKKQTPPSCAGSLGIRRDSFKYTLLSFLEEEVTFEGKKYGANFFLVIALIRQAGLWKWAAFG